MMHERISSSLPTRDYRHSMTLCPPPGNDSKTPDNLLTEKAIAWLSALASFLLIGSMCGFYVWYLVHTHRW